MHGPCDCWMGYGASPNLNAEVHVHVTLSLLVLGGYYPVAPALICPFSATVYSPGVRATARTGH